MLEEDEPTSEELAALPEWSLRYLAHHQKLNVMLALRLMRTMRAREALEAERQRRFSRRPRPGRRGVRS